MRLAWLTILLAIPCRCCELRGRIEPPANVAVFLQDANRPFEKSVATVLEAAAREVQKQRFTSLDREIRRMGDSTAAVTARFTVVAASGAHGGRKQFVAERLMFLEKATGGTNDRLRTLGLTVRVPAEFSRCEASRRQSPSTHADSARATRPIRPQQESGRGQRIPRWFL